MGLFKRKTPDEKKANMEAKQAERDRKYAKKLEAKQAEQDRKYAKKLENVQILCANDLKSDETIQYFLQGRDDLRETYLVLTETRVIYREIFTSKSITLDKITSFEKGLSRLIIKGSHTGIEIDHVTIGDINNFVNKMDELQNVTGESVEEHSVSLSPVQQLKEYKELLDLEIITQEEFDNKKKELLNL